MANAGHLKIVRLGPEVLAEWREAHAGPMDLVDANLVDANLVGANLAGANLRDAHLSGSNLRGANLRGANLRGAHLRGVQLARANLARADLAGAHLRAASLAGANLNEANLSRANLAGADLSDANLVAASFADASLGDANLDRAKLNGANIRGASLGGAHLRGADLRGAVLSESDFSDADMTHARFGSTSICCDVTRSLGLETCQHSGPSAVAHSVLLRKTSNPWPERFLRGVGLTDAEIDFVRSFAANPIEFYSAFISYSSKNDAFAVKLHDALQARGVRCWLDKHEILPGDKIAAKIHEGIRLWDKVLLCCSEASLSKESGWWVTNEIERAIEKERTLQRDRGRETLAIIPIDLDGFLFTDACGHEHGPTLRARAAPSFRDPARFDEQLALVIKALRSDALVRRPPPSPKL